MPDFYLEKAGNGDGRKWTLLTRDGEFVVLLERGFFSAHGKACGMGQPDAAHVRQLPGEPDRPTRDVVSRLRIEIAARKAKGWSHEAESLARWAVKEITASGRTIDPDAPPHVLADFLIDYGINPALGELLSKLLAAC